MFREIILPIFRSTRLCVTTCGKMHPRCCRPPAGGVHPFGSYTEVSTCIVTVPHALSYSAPIQRFLHVQSPCPFRLLFGSYTGLSTFVVTVPTALTYSAPTQKYLHAQSPCLLRYPIRLLHRSIYMCSHRVYCALLFGSYTGLSTCLVTVPTALSYSAPTQKYLHVQSPCLLRYPIRLLHRNIYMCSHRAYCPLLFSSYTECPSIFMLVYRRTDTSLLHIAQLKVLVLTKVPNRLFGTSISTLFGAQKFPLPRTLPLGR